MSKMLHWDDSFYVKVYELAKTGLSNRKIAEAIGTSIQSFKKWIALRPALKQALLDARSHHESATDTFISYVYKQLPPHLQRLWDKISEYEEGPNYFAKLEALFEKHGRVAQQHLFFHALVSFNFNPSEACRKVGITRSTLLSWMRDPEFHELFDEFHWHKGNFFEGHLVKLVGRGDSSATIFANKTFNRKRGYSDKVEHEHTGEVNHNHKVTLDDLPLEVKKKLLEQHRLKREPKLIEEVKVELPEFKELNGAVPVVAEVPEDI